MAMLLTMMIRTGESFVQIVDEVLNTQDTLTHLKLPVVSVEIDSQQGGFILIMVVILIRM